MDVSDQELACGCVALLWGSRNTYPGLAAKVRLVIETFPGLPNHHNTARAPLCTYLGSAALKKGQGDSCGRKRLLSSRHQKWRRLSAPCKQWGSLQVHGNL